MICQSVERVYFSANRPNTIHFHLYPLPTPAHLMLHVFAYVRLVRAGSEAIMYGYAKVEKLNLSKNTENERSLIITVAGAFG